MDQLATKVIDLKSSTLQSVVVRFDGTIENRTGSFLIELSINLISEYIDSVRLMKFTNMYERLSLNHLLDFYSSKTNSPFKNFKLDEFRHLYLPRTQKFVEENND